jgi:hypothetical protein
MRVMLAAAALFFPQAAPAHSLHNPKHGGIFFPAAQDTLHIEGVWPAQRLFKLYLYDEVDRPLAPARVRGIHAWIEAKGQQVPLIPAADGSFLVARVPPMSVPAQIPVQIRLTEGAEPEGFYFTFADYSDEQALGFSLEPTVIPATSAGVVAALRGDGREAETLVARHENAFVFAPATRGKDHALALERFLPQLAAGRRPRAAAAIRAVVRAAWLLHTAGDDGTADQVSAAAAGFRAAIDEAAAAFGITR